VAVFGLFGKSRFLDADIEDWCLETWAWLMAHLGGMQRLQTTTLALPTRAFFPPTETEGHERALYILGLVKAQMGMAEWDCELEPYDRPTGRQRVGHYAAVQHGKSAHGTFRIEDNRVIISYATDLLDQPRRLIATLAHELSHYLLATVRAPLPGGNELHELATELTVAYAGFAVFSANTAFAFEQHQDNFGQGWSAKTSGYFSERTWAFAIALFCALKNEAPPVEHLKDGVAELTRKAARYLKGREDLLAPLRAIA
jgi:hypothetical protein